MIPLLATGVMAAAALWVGPHGRRSAMLVLVGATLSSGGLD